jgi:pyruvate/2-oxoglutarate/acetoin dehydrogenase E1 component
MKTLSESGVKVKTLTMRQAIIEALSEEMERDSSTVLFGEDVGKFGGVFGATKGLHEKFGQRVFDTPIAETTIVAAALGMAITGGMRPIPELQFGDFVGVAFDEVFHKLGKWRWDAWRTNGNSRHFALTNRYCGRSWARAFSKPTSHFYACTRFENCCSFHSI